MGRLFWKFFVFVALAQLTAIIGIGGAIWLKDRAHINGLLDDHLRRPPPPMLDSAVATLQYGGIAALRSLLQSMAGEAVFAVDEHGQELLGRPIDPSILIDVRGSLEKEKQTDWVKQVKGGDEHTYLVFFLPSSHLNGRLPFPGDRPPLPEHHLIPTMPIVVGAIASLIFAALLAWYFSTPIRNLRTAFAAVARGDLNTSVAPAMGERRDELADLGNDFDRMASQLRAVMESQRRLLHDVSHEIRSPLARLQAAVGLVRQQPEKSSMWIERIERETVRMDKLINELLTLSRLEAGSMGAMADNVNMDELVEDIANDAHFEAKVNNRNIEFSVSFAVSIKGQAELLHRAIENVVRNATKHTAENSTVLVEGHLEVGRRRLILRVSDEGPGIPETELTAIFEPFFRGSGTSKNTDGHGLGLAIARRIVEAHGGTISAFNRPKGGLCIEIALPVERV